MKTEQSSTRRDAWTSDEERVMKNIVIRMTREGYRLNEIYKRVSHRTGRTVAAVAYRWNTVLRDVYNEDFMKARFDARVNLGKTNRGLPVEKDERFILPKEEPKSKIEDVDQEIKTNPLYNDVLNLMINAQRKQVAYGLDKYVESLNVDSWSVVETIDHIISETVDQLHYLTMLKHKLIKERMEK